MTVEEQIQLLLKAKDYASPNINKTSQSIKNLKNNIDDLGKSKIDKSISKLNLGILTAGLFKAGQKMIQFSKQSSDYIETLNVLDVAFNNNTKSIKEFTSRIAETLNLDDATLIKATASFKTLANSMQYTNEVGTDFSKMLTQMTLDLSSLYNINFQKAQSALQYAIQGQGKTLKALTGASVLETTIQTTLDALGVDAYVEDMTDAEKAMARVITISYQLQNSQGDLARTIESPANQFKVLGEQITQLTRNIGNVLLPTLGALLPYLNGILIAINTILKGISALVGFDETSWDFFEEGTNSFDNLGASIGGVGDSAAKAKKQLSGLREFDKLNVLRTPTSSSGGAGGASGAGNINPKLLSAFNDIFAKYNDNLDGIKTKASKIAEDILKWLGFSKEIDPLSGEIKLKYMGLSTTIKNIWESFKGLSPTLKFIVGLGVGLAATKLYNILRKLLQIVGATGLGKAIKDLISPSKFLVSYALSGVTNGNKLSKIISSLNVFMVKLKSSITGIIAVAGGTAILYDSFKKANEEGWNLNNTIGTLGGTFATFAGAIKIGWQFGGAYGAAIGAATAAVVTLTTAVIASNNALSPQEKQLKQIKDALSEYNETMKETETLTDKQLVSGLIQTTYHQNLLDELNELVDANGRVKDGNEERVNFILNQLSEAYGIEASLINGQIQDYDKLKNQIASLIKQKQAEYYVTKLQAIAEKAREQQPTLLKQIQDAELELTNAELKEKRTLDILNQATDEYKNAKKRAGESDADFMKRQTELLTAMSNAKTEHQKATEMVNKYRIAKDEATTAMQKNNEKIQSYETAYGKFLSGQYDSYADIINEYKNVYIDANGNMVKVSEDSVAKIVQDKKKQLYEEKSTNQELYNDTVNTLKNQTKAVGDLSDEQAAEWAALAIVDRDTFMKEFGQLPQKIQDQIVNKMKQKGIDISSQLQNGLDQNQPTINVNSKFNSYGLKTGMESFFKRNSAVFGAAGLNIPTIQYAQGGLPGVGQMFIANERGPELVGQIGGQSFVANQNQMMDIIDKKLSNAGGLQNATFVIQVGSEEVARTVLKDLNSMAKSNGKPITIGG